MGFVDNFKGTGSSWEEEGTSLAADIKAAEAALKTT